MLSLRCHRFLRILSFTDVNLSALKRFSIELDSFRLSWFDSIRGHIKTSWRCVIVERRFFSFKNIVINSKRISFNTLFCEFKASSEHRVKILRFLGFKTFCIILSLDYISRDIFQCDCINSSLLICNETILTKHFTCVLDDWDNVLQLAWEFLFNRSLMNVN